MATAAVSKDSRVPVTVLTGFLGSEKTTLLNRILTEEHGKCIAVIENEFGEVGVDQELVIGAEEEIFEMNNGCICCTVRGDLIRILGNLMKRRDKFDHILVETTGMADPGPVAQTFFVDDEMQTKLRLDGIVTLVDAKHVWQHIDDSAEVKEQIAFADVILLNKIDLVTYVELERLEARIRAMNAAAKIVRTQNAAAEIDAVLNVGGFSLDHAFEVGPKFMEPEYPFEWAGIYSLAAGSQLLKLDIGPDPSISVVVLPVEASSRAALEAVEMDAVLLFSESGHKLLPGEKLAPGRVHYELSLDGKPAEFEVEIRRAAQYAFFTEHRPVEFHTELHNSGCLLETTLEREYKPDHEHNEAVSSVGITIPGDLDNKKFNQWLSLLLQTRGTDIFRMKGVLSLKGEENRFVFQGVHMLFDGRPDRLASALSEIWRTSIDESTVVVGWSPSRPWLAAAAANGSICIFDGETGESACRWSGHRFGVTRLAWHPQAPLFATAGQDGRVRLWEACLEGLLGELDCGAEWVEHIAWSANGEYLATGAGRKLKLWSKTGDLIRAYPDHPHTIAAIAWSAADDELVSACYGQLQFWAPGESRAQRTFTWKGSMLALAWSPDKRYLCHGNQDATVHFWIVTPGKELKNLSTN